MISVYAIPGAAALIEWLLAAGLYAWGWRRTNYRLYRLGDSLAVGGMVTALAGTVWLAWDVSPALALTAGSLTSLLAVVSLVIYGAFAYRRTERVSAFAVIGFAVLAQAYTEGRLWMGVEVEPMGLFLPVWLAIYMGIGLAGYGALVVGAAAIVVNSALHRMSSYLTSEQLSARVGLPRLEWNSLRVGLVALSLSLTAELIRLWWGQGRVIAAGFVWGLVAWLLLAAGVYGLARNAISRRVAHVLLVIASAAGVVAVLSGGG